MVEFKNSSLHGTPFALFQAHLKSVFFILNKENKMIEKKRALALGFVATAVVAVLVLGSSAMASEEATAKAKPSICCPFSQCLDCGTSLCNVKKPLTAAHDGTKVHFCGAQCLANFKANPASLLKKRKNSLLAIQSSCYPVKTCVVSGTKLDKMGKPHDLLFNDRLVRFCCKDCVPAFKKNPAKYLAALDKAVIAQQKPVYPLDTCPVSGTKLGKMGKPYDHVFGNFLIRFCCKGCVQSFEKNPGKYLPKLMAAWTKKHGAKSCSDGNCSSKEGGCSGGSCGTGCTDKEKTTTPAPKPKPKKVQKPKKSC